MLRLEPGEWHFAGGRFDVEPYRLRIALVCPWALRSLKEADTPNVCTWYWSAWDLFDDRDDVMHEARTDFTSHALGWHEINLDTAILCIARWAAANHAEELAALDDQLAAFVRKGVSQWGGSDLQPPRWSPPKAGS